MPEAARGGSAAISGGPPHGRQCPACPAGSRAGIAWREEELQNGGGAVGGVEERHLACKSTHGEIIQNTNRQQIILAIHF